jgi:hypothetical protein
VSRRDLKTQLASAKMRADIAGEKLRAARIKASYDLLSGETKRTRSQPSIEYASEEAQLNQRGRLHGVARGRDLFRNMPAARALVTQLAVHVYGRMPKALVHSDNAAWGKAAAKWFNSTWAKRADGRGGLHLHECNRCSLAAVVREGDILQYFDRAGVIPGGQGRLWFWEADQIAPIKPGDWKQYAGRIASALGIEGKAQQADGLVLDQWGRVWGYVVGARYGAFDLAYRPDAPDKNEATILPATDARLLFSPWRINQRRGISEIVACGNTLIDADDLWRAGLFRARAQSYIALKVTKQDAAAIAAGRADYTDGTSSARIDVDSAALETTDHQYRNFEKLSRGAIEYVEPGEDINPVQMGGDSPEIADLVTQARVLSGHSIGLSRMFATGQADASYSAARAELNLSQPTVRLWQKWAERYQLDWQAERAIAWAVEQGELDPAPAGGFSVSWAGWQKFGALNPAQEAGATETELRIGAISWEDILGPDWQEKLESLGTQIQTARDAGFWPPTFPLQSSGVAQK